MLFDLLNEIEQQEATAAAITATATAISTGESNPSPPIATTSNSSTAGEQSTTTAAGTQQVQGKNEEGHQSPFTMTRQAGGNVVNRLEQLLEAAEAELQRVTQQAILASVGVMGSTGLDGSPHYSSPPGTGAPPGTTGMTSSTGTSIKGPGPNTALTSGTASGPFASLPEISLTPEVEDESSALISPSSYGSVGRRVSVDTGGLNTPPCDTLPSGEEIDENEVKRTFSGIVAHSSSLVPSLLPPSSLGHGLGSVRALSSSVTSSYMYTPERSLLVPLTTKNESYRVMWNVLTERIFDEELLLGEGSAGLFVISHFGLVCELATDPMVAEIIVGMAASGAASPTHSTGGSAEGGGGLMMRQQNTPSPGTLSPRTPVVATGGGGGGAPRISGRVEPLPEGMSDEEQIAHVMVVAFTAGLKALESFPSSEALQTLLSQVEHRDGERTRRRSSGGVSVLIKQRESIASSTQLISFGGALSPLRPASASSATSSTIPSSLSNTRVLTSPASPLKSSEGSGSPKKPATAPVLPHHANITLSTLQRRNENELFCAALISVCEGNLSREEKNILHRSISFLLLRWAQYPSRRAELSTAFALLATHNKKIAVQHFLSGVVRHIATLKEGKDESRLRKFMCCLFEELASVLMSTAPPPALKGVALQAFCTALFYPAAVAAPVSSANLKGGDAPGVGGGRSSNTTPSKSPTLSETSSGLSPLVITRSPPDEAVSAMNVRSKTTTLGGIPVVGAGRDPLSPQQHSAGSTSPAKSVLPPMFVLVLNTLFVSNEKLGEDLCPAGALGMDLFGSGYGLMSSDNGTTPTTTQSLRSAGECFGDEERTVPPGGSAERRRRSGSEGGALSDESDDDHGESDADAEGEIEDEELEEYQELIRRGRRSFVVVLKYTEGHLMWQHGVMPTHREFLRQQAAEKAAAEHAKVDTGTGKRQKENGGSTDPAGAVDDSDLGTNSPRRFLSFPLDVFISPSWIVEPMLDATTGALKGNPVYVLAPGLPEAATTPTSTPSTTPRKSPRKALGLGGVSDGGCPLEVNRTLTGSMGSTATHATAESGTGSVNSCAASNPASFVLRAIHDVTQWIADQFSIPMPGGEPNKTPKAQQQKDGSHTTSTGTAKARGTSSAKSIRKIKAIGEDRITALEVLMVLSSWFYGTLCLPPALPKEDEDRARLLFGLAPSLRTQTAVDEGVRDEGEGQELGRITPRARATSNENRGEKTVLPRLPRDGVHDRLALCGASIAGFMAYVRDPRGSLDQLAAMAKTTSGSLSLSNSSGCFVPPQIVLPDASLRRPLPPLLQKCDLFLQTVLEVLYILEPCASEPFLHRYGTYSISSGSAVAATRVHQHHRRCEQDLMIVFEDANVPLTYLLAEKTVTVPSGGSAAASAAADSALRRARMLGTGGGMGTGGNIHKTVAQQVVQLLDWLASPLSGDKALLELAQSILPLVSPPPTAMSSAHPSLHLLSAPPGKDPSSPPEMQRYGTHVFVEEIDALVRRQQLKLQAGKKEDGDAGAGAPFGSPARSPHASTVHLLGLDQNASSSFDTSDGQGGGGCDDLLEQKMLAMAQKRMESVVSGMAGSGSAGGGSGSSPAVEAHEVLIAGLRQRIGHLNPGVSRVTVTFVLDDGKEEGNNAPNCHPVPWKKIPSPAVVPTAVAQPQQSPGHQSSGPNSSGSSVESTGSNGSSGGGKATSTSPFPSKTDLFGPQMLSLPPSSTPPGIDGSADPLGDGNGDGKGKGKMAGSISTSDETNSSGGGGPDHRYSASSEFSSSLTANSSPSAAVDLFSMWPS